MRICKVIHVVRQGHTLSQGLLLVCWSRAVGEGLYDPVEFELTQMSDVVVTVLEAVVFSSPIGEYSVEGVWRVIHSGWMAINSHL